MPKIHELKIIDQCFNDIITELKQFEIRKNDRNYKVGDILHMREYNDGAYTGKETMQEVTYISKYAQHNQHIVMSIKKVPMSYYTYINMNEKEKFAFHEIVSHISLYDTRDRDVANTLWDILHNLVEIDDFEQDDDIKWYTDLWLKKDVEKMKHL